MSAFVWWWNSDDEEQDELNDELEHEAITMSHEDLDDAIKAQMAELESSFNKLNEEQVSSLITVGALLLFGIISSTSKSENSNPPQLAELLLEKILSKEERENLIGDLAEEFTERQSVYGIRSTNFWYWRQVKNSAWPIIQVRIKLALGDLIRRFTK
jgi:hypothetical protein